MTILQENYTSEQYALSSYKDLLDTYLKYILNFLRRGGKIGMTVPGFMKDPKGNIPAHVKSFLNDELWTWVTLGWWRNLWESSGFVTVNIADTLQDGCLLWQKWYEALHSIGKNRNPHEIEYFKIDKGGV